MSPGTPLGRATAVLQTLLSIPPDRCNAANLVYALTLSAKLQVPATNPLRHHGDDTTENDDEDDMAVSQEVAVFRSLLVQAVQVMREMVSMKQKKKGGLTPRQLCNAAWALAKHVDRDPFLLRLKAEDRPAGSTLTHDDTPAAIGETKNDDDNSNHVLVVDLAVDEIAASLIRTLQSNSTMVKNGELCMAAWAYGVLRERQRPPGWKTRPRMGTVVLPKQPPAPPPSTDHSSFPNHPGASFFQFVRNEEWDSKSRRPMHNPSRKLFGKLKVPEVHDDEENDDNLEEDVIQVPSPTITDFLFDEIALALNQPAVIGVEPHLEAVVNGTELFGSSDLSDVELGEEEDSVAWRIDTCQWNELAIVAWAFATHGWSCSPSAELVLMRIANETTRRLKKGQRLPLKANGSYMPYKLSRYAGEHKSKRASSRDIAQLIWSLGIAQSDNFRLADSLVAVVETLRDNLRHYQMNNKDGPSYFSRWSCADLVQVALSLAHARMDESEILCALYQESLRRLPTRGNSDSMDGNRQTFFFWEVTILLWAQARLHLTVEQDAIFEEFSTAVVASLHAAAVEAQDGETQSLQSIGIGSQEKANLVWSLVILEQYNSSTSIDLLSRIFAEVSSECQVEGCIQLEHAHQLWQALFLLESESPLAVADTPAWFRDYLQSQWRNEKARPKLSSARHRALSHTLSQMGVAHHNEDEEDIDVAIVLEPNALWTHQAAWKTASEHGGAQDVPNGNRNGECIVKVAVEFDGPNHFTRHAVVKGKQSNSPKSPSHIGPSAAAESPPPPRSLGHSILKYRLLKKQGWTVIRIPYYEFDKIPFWASMERQRYLQRLLKTHSTLKFSDADVSEYKPPVLDRKSRFD